jgi:RNA polymerase sigma-70 factor, ECF subfamily
VENRSKDTQLLELVKNSDMGAFRSLFEQYQPILFRHVLYQTGEEESAHDIVQETFIRVWEHRKSIRPKLSFYAYLARISRNLVYDRAKHLKIRERSRAFAPNIELSEKDDPGEALNLNILQERLASVINNDLPERCREIFLLSRFDGKTHKEIACILNLSVRTIENQIAHALKVLRRKLDI